MKACSKARSVRRTVNNPPSFVSSNDAITEAQEPLKIEKLAHMKGCRNDWNPCTPKHRCCEAKHIREKLGGLFLHCRDCDQEILSMDFYKDKETSIYYKAGRDMGRGYHPQTVGYDGEIKRCRCMDNQTRIEKSPYTLDACREWGRRFHTSEYWGPNQRWTVTPLGQLNVRWLGPCEEKWLSIAFGCRRGTRELVWYLDANFEPAIFDRAILSRNPEDGQ